MKRESKGVDSMVSLAQSGKMMYLHDQKWESCDVNIETSKIHIYNQVFEKKINLDSNMALHGAVLFENVHYMAQVDHELCFGLEKLNEESFSGKSSL
jgi:hypothetical protein